MDIIFSRNPIPASFPDVYVILQELLKGVQNTLGSHLVGMYLEGSLAGGDFDQDSDIDFVVVTDEELSEKLFAALQAMHDQIALLDSPWAIQLEGSYISQLALRRHDPNLALHPNLERGHGERLKLAHHDETWNIHRRILREHGITLMGPAPCTLIDPILPDELRQAMLPALEDWAAHILAHPNEIIHQGYQSYTVLSLCRILYTLQWGEVVSKHKAAGWAKEASGGKWNALIDQAWIGRHQPHLMADTDDINQTLELIKYTLERGRQFNVPPAH
jgi:hypothetical protein